MVWPGMWDFSLADLVSVRIATAALFATGVPAWVKLHKEHLAKLQFTTGRAGSPRHLMVTIGFEAETRRTNFKVLVDIVRPGTADLSVPAPIGRQGGAFVSAPGYGPGDPVARGGKLEQPLQFYGPQDTTYCHTRVVVSLPDGEPGAWIRARVIDEANGKTVVMNREWISTR